MPDEPTLSIDRGRCYGSGDCELLRSDLFRLDAEGIGTVARPPTADDLDIARLAVERCPSGAIALQI